MDRHHWRRVESLDSGAAEQDALGVLGGGGFPDASRYRSDTGDRAVLVPTGSLRTGPESPVSFSDPAPEGGELLFIDPANESTAVSLVSALGDRSRSVRVALPEDTNPVFLVPDAGRVYVTVGGEQVEYAIFRLGQRMRADRDELAAGPKVRESADVLDRRSDWFERREGGRHGR